MKVTTNNNVYDIAVVGGHLVGSLFVSLLAHSGYRILVIEKQKAKKNFALKTAFDPRVYAINTASQQVFQQADLWEKIQASRAFPYYSMAVWDKGGRGHIEFHCHDVLAPNLGHIVEEQVLLNATLASLQGLSEVKLVYGRSLVSLTRHPDQIELLLDNAETVCCKLLVGADGSQSRVRELIGVGQLQGNYEQQAIVATVHTAHSHKNTAWQRFLPTGPLAFLPLSDKHCSIVWSVDSGYAQDLMSLGAMVFEQRLTQAFESRLGAVSLVSAPQQFPLRYLHAKQYCLPRIVLIGDAAHTIHPLAGQGVNLGILDAATLAKAITQDRKALADPGLFRLLRAYERERKSHNLLTLGAMNGFKALFGSTNPALVGLRNTGLLFVNQCTELKRFIMRQATGTNS